MLRSGGESQPPWLGCLEPRVVKSRCRATQQFIPSLDLASMPPALAFDPATVSCFRIFERPATKRVTYQEQFYTRQNAPQ